MDVLFTHSQKSKKADLIFKKTMLLVSLGLGMFSSGCKVGFIVCNTVGLSYLENATVIRKLLWGLLNVALQLFWACFWNA